MKTGDPRNNPKALLIKRKQNVGCLVVFLLIVFVCGGWYYHNQKIKNYAISSLSDSCKKYFAHPVIETRAFKESAQSKKAEQYQLYDQCRSDVEAYTKKHGLKMPGTWNLNAENMKLIYEDTVVFGILPNNWRGVVTNAISPHLRDQRSAKFTYYDQKQRIEWHNGKRYVYYDVPVGVNAKNSFGGYTGEQRWYVIFGDGIQVKAPR